MGVVLKFLLNQWFQTSNRSDNMELDEFFIMPNHIHVIFIFINHELVQGAEFTPAQSFDSEFILSSVVTQLQEKGQPQGLPVWVGDIIEAFKSLVARDGLEIYKSQKKFMGKFGK